MVFCSKCGAQSPDDMAFCPRCGTKLAVQEPIRVQPPIPPANYAPAQRSYSPPPSPRKKLPIIAIVAIVVCVVIAAAVLIASGALDNGAYAHGVREGDYMDYKLTMTFGSTSVTGTSRMSFSNVTETSMDLTKRIEVAGIVETSTATMTLHGDTWELEDANSDSTSPTTTTKIGTETIQTKLGSKQCTHTRTIGSGYVQDAWITETCILKITILYDDGDKMAMEITGTNIGNI